MNTSELTELKQVVCEWLSQVLDVQIVGKYAALYEDFLDLFWAQRERLNITQYSVGEYCVSFLQVLREGCWRLVHFADTIGLDFARKICKTTLWSST